MNDNADPGVLRRAWNTIVRTANTIIDPRPAAIKWYVLAVLIAAVGGTAVLGPLFYGHKASTPFALISPHDVIVSVPPPVPMPASASPKDLAPLKLLKVKEPAAKKAVTRKRKAKVTAARSDTRF